MNALCICTSFHEEIRKSKYPPPDDKYLLDIFCHTTVLDSTILSLVIHDTWCLLLTPFLIFFCISHIWMSQKNLNFYYIYNFVFIKKILNYKSDDTYYTSQRLLFFFVFFFLELSLTPRNEWDAQSFWGRRDRSIKLVKLEWSKNICIVLFWEVLSIILWVFLAFILKNLCIFGWK